MSPRLTLATAERVLRQVRHDPRTIGLLVGLPCLVLWLIAWMFEGTPVLDQFGPLLLGLFPLVVMFLVTSVATLRERQSGTLERLMTLPVGRGDIVIGYALAFGALAVLQALVLTGFAVLVLGMEVAGALWVVVLVAVLDGLLGTALGLAASAAARTEFQAVQMMPLIIFPQLVTAGLMMPRDQMPTVLEVISRAMPLTYGLEALQDLAAGAGLHDVRGAVTAVALFIVGALMLGTATLRRSTR
ncbi:ABC transporter permease [Actinotalea sp. K2]|uniref:ABC transporter permease n=1 Tax=Actinotalea sp. K2 TaxID=2939438 RepID=UPI002017F7FE|nr:ABC transporter permease [Actinotalea sp. K2]MCL3863088.1 ABC transporter permease [Actinotalea sp. K2]